MAFSFELKLAIFSELYGAISAGPEHDHSLTLLIPLFPSAPALSVVKHVVKEPFLTRHGVRCRRLSRRALFHVWGWGIVPLS